MRRYLLFFLLTFLLNFVWESWHAVYFYVAPTSDSLAQVGSYRGFVALITRVAVTDAIILLIILIGGAIIWRSKDWFLSLSPAKYGYFVGIAMLWAAGIEYYALSIDRWDYSALMPTIFGIGLSPLVQLAVTGLIALHLVQSWNGAY